MDEQIIQDILAEVFSALEPLDAQSAAILQFLKAKGLATDDELAPFLQQARNASNVRWLAARVRIGSLLNSALKSVDTKPTEVSSKETKPAPQTSGLPPTESKTEEAERTKQTNQKNKAEETTQASAGESQQKKPAPAQTSPNKAEQTTQQTATDEDSGEAKAEAPQKGLKETAA
jgi:cytoskeletal protein RodZ